jgi:hypothetical protein
MQIATTSWHLNLQCPCCGQGQPLLVACIRCGHVAAECEEAATFFPDPFQLKPSPSSLCGECGAAGIGSFAPASSAQIQSAGFRPGQYQ